MNKETEVDHALPGKTPCAETLNRWTLDTVWERDIYLKALDSSGWKELAVQCTSHWMD